MSHARAVTRRLPPILRADACQHDVRRSGYPNRYTVMKSAYGRTGGSPKDRIAACDAVARFSVWRSVLPAVLPAVSGPASRCQTRRDLVRVPVYPIEPGLSEVFGDGRNRLRVYESILPSELGRGSTEGAGRHLHERGAGPQGAVRVAVGRHASSWTRWRRRRRAPWRCAQGARRLSGSGRYRTHRLDLRGARARC